MKKIIGIAAAAVIVLGLSLVIYNQIIPDEYVPTDDEIALHLKLDTEEDVGLLVYDYRAGGREYSGGISNADGSLIQHDSDNIVVWNREELNLSSDTFELSMQFRIITEYVRRPWRLIPSPLRLDSWMYPPNSVQSFSSPDRVSSKFSVSMS